MIYKTISLERSGTQFGDRLVYIYELAAATGNSEVNII
jgi:hypothetical protein